MEKKYILTDETKEFKGHILHRIQTVKDFGDVRAGELGGWIEKEENLSHEGTCWVSNKAMIFDDALVDESAQVCGRAKIFGKAIIFGHAWVCENACVCDWARVFGDAIIYGNAQIRDDAKICGKAKVKNNAVISDTPVIESRTILATDAKISSEKDFITIGPIGSRDDYVTFYKTIDDDIRVCVGCFTGKPLEEFEHAVVVQHSGTQYAKEYQAAVELAKIHLRKVTFIKV